MMRTTAIVGSACIVLAGLSCDLTGPRDLPHAVATFRCGPADGPATGIMLARDPIEGLARSYPYLSVVIWEGLSALPGRQWEVDAASVRYLRGPGIFQDAIAGTVRVDRVDNDNRVIGSVELRFPSLMLSEQFSAPWVESFILCG